MLNKRKECFDELSTSGNFSAISILRAFVLSLSKESVRVLQHPTGRLGYAMKRALALGLAIFLVVQNGSAAAASPEDQVRQTIDEVLAILKDPQLKGERKKHERRMKMRDAVHRRFDFVEMARRSLGADWRRLSPEQQKEFVAIFTDLIEDAYLTRIEAYNGEKVEYLRERTDGNYAEVATQLIDNMGRELSINYRLHNVNGAWKVYDVVIEDISLVNNYRAQFRRVLARSSIQELLERMREKAFSPALAKT
jgi:phospholipid transport system substrate-binding protein